VGAVNIFVVIEQSVYLTPIL